MPEEMDLMISSVKKLRCCWK